MSNIINRLKTLIDNAKKQGHAIIKIEDIENNIPEVNDSINTVTTKFHVGDWIIENNFRHKILQIKEITKNGNILFTNGTYICKEFVEIGYHLWTLNDAKDGDILAFDDNTIVMFKDLYNSTTFHSYCHIEDDIFTISDNDLPDWWEGKGFYPANKKQRQFFFQKMKEAGYEWDENNKILKEIVEDEEEPQNYKNQVMSEITDLVKHYIKQKPACSEASEDIKEALRTEYEKGRADAIAQMQKEWSEEDEKCIRLSTDIIDSALRAGFCVQLDRDRCVEWFNSRRPQKQWEPSDEQMRALNSTAGIVGILTPTGVTLCSLYHDLEKLKGE